MANWLQYALTLAAVGLAAWHLGCAGLRAARQLTGATRSKCAGCCLSAGCENSTKRAVLRKKTPAD
jgi:hypothetical protein